MLNQLVASIHLSIDRSIDLYACRLHSSVHRAERGAAPRRLTGKASPAMSTTGRQPTRSASPKRSGEPSPTGQAQAPSRAYPLILLPRPRPREDSTGRNTTPRSAPTTGVSISQPSMLMHARALGNRTGRVECLINSLVGSVAHSDLWQPER
jgi:hypothetical protein